MEPLTSQHVAIDPTVCGGKAHVAGTRIRVQDIFLWHEREGFTPDEIVGRFPELTMADVYAALAYYWDHRDEIERQMQQAAETADAMKAVLPSKLAQKLAQRGGDGNSLPSR